MWANASPSYFSGLASVPAVPLLRDRPAKNVDKTSASRRDQTTNPSANFLGQSDLFLPAVEGPPSPDSLRRLNTEMRLAANLRRGQGHKADSSSSSITSFTGEIEQALENIDLVRRSSFNSIESSNVSKDTTEVFQQFSKNLFHRRGRSKQESTSSASSLYSADVPVDTTTGLKESVLPKLFARRKPSRDEPAAVQKRFQISGPFNFQHVTHTNRDAAEDAMTPDEDQPETNQMHSRPRAATGASDHTYTNVLTETVAEHGDFTDIPPPRPGLIARHTGSFQTMRRFIKSGKISELSVPGTTLAPTSAPSNQNPPQRPPRSPLEPISPETTSPPRPPRISSRQTLYPALIDTTAIYPVERPITSGGFQRPQPFSPSSPIEQLPTPTRQAFTPPADLSTFSHDGLIGRPQTATPEPAWPLASPTIVNFEVPLPDLVDDDGRTSWSSRAHTNRNSANASLRGSKSVPMLRKLAEEQDETSAWSSQMKADLAESLVESPTLGRASWEDDIDYCYEHEAEADCDYQWERPSMDVAHGNMMYHAPQSYSALDQALMKPSTKKSPGMLSASGFEVPELSPASQTSAVLGHEAITPLINQAGAAATDSPFHKQTALSVPNEADDYQFSPSLLVPQDYQRESLTADVYHVHGLEPSLQRSSTATTESNYTSSTDSVGERHTSTNSSWTALTRHTASTSSLNKMATSWVDEAEPVPSLAAPIEPTEEDETTPPASEDVVPELVMAIPPPGRRAMHKSHASESILRNSGVQQLPQSNRPRARTSSLSQPPPVGQYALFPRSNIKTHGDRI